MSLSLRVFFVSPDYLRPGCNVYREECDHLSFKDDSSLFGRISSCNTNVIPEGMHLVSYDQDIREERRITRHDDYDNELTYVLAGELAKVSPNRGDGIPWPVFPENEAILAYIRALPPETPIILEWH